MRDESDPLADLIELQPAWVKTFDLPGGEGAYWTIFPNSDSVEIRAEMIQPTVNLWSFGVWYWPEALAVVLALLVLMTGRWWWFARRGKDPRCRKCGYDLTNLKSESCPECGTVLTSRNRVTGFRSRWRMAVAFAALLIISGTWWFGEGRLPRHGWISEKVQWHWAVHRDSIDWPDWYVLHGSEYVEYTTFDVSRSHITTTAQFQFATGFSTYPTIISFEDEMRAWGRFAKMEHIWLLDADHCRITQHDSDGSLTLTLPFCGDDTWVTYVRRSGGRYSNCFHVYSKDGTLLEYPALPSPLGDGWFILIGREIVHFDPISGTFTSAVAIPDIGVADRGVSQLVMRPVMGSRSLAIVYGRSGYLVDLASHEIVQQVDQHFFPNEIAIALLATGEEEHARNAMQPFGGLIGRRLLTGDRSNLVSRCAQSGAKVAGSLAQARWQHRLVDPANIPPGSEVLFTTGPGPRDVNVFFIDGGQLTLAVYEIPEAE